MAVRPNYAIVGVLFLGSLLVAACGASDTSTHAGDEGATSTVTVPVITPGKGPTAVTNVTIATDRGSYAPVSSTSTGSQFKLCQHSSHRAADSCAAS
jgi:hypothetical protein